MKSPVASFTLACSSVKNRVRVTIFVLMASTSPPSPLVCTAADMVAVEGGSLAKGGSVLILRQENFSGGRETRMRTETTCEAKSRQTERVVGPAHVC